jgi:hypothetical protein
MQAPELGPILSRLQSIPRDPSDYTLGASEAGVRFGIVEPTLAAMRQASLWNGVEGDGAAYALHDLHYLGLRLGSARTYVWAMGLWRRSLARILQAERTEIEVTYLPQLPDARQPVRGDVLLDSDCLCDVSLRHGEPCGEMSATLYSRWPRLPRDIRQVLGEIASWDYCMMPPRLFGDTKLARRLAMTDCWTAACCAIEGLRAAGWDARLAQGLIIGLPFGTPHAWAEVAIEETWTPIDPLMISAMQKYGGLDRVAWPFHRSLGPLLVRIAAADRLTPLVGKGGEWIPTLYLVRLVE